MIDLQEKAYDAFCNGQLSQRELRDALETISLINLSTYLTTKEKQDGRLQTNIERIPRGGTERR